MPARTNVQRAYEWKGCPSDGLPDRGGGFPMSKRKIVLLIVFVLIVLVIIGASTSGPPEGEPNKFAVFFVTGGPPESVYTVLFGLMDERNRNIAADGEVALKIIDQRGRILYEETRKIRVSDFSRYRHVIFGGEIWGYSWDIDASKVRPGAPSILGFGKAEATFKRKDGVTFKSEDSTVRIPSLPTVVITGIEAEKADKNLQVFVMRPFETHFAGDVITLEMRISYFTLSGPETMLIRSIEVLTPGFKIVSVSPTPPFEVGRESKTIVLTLEAPNGEFKGVLRISVK
jgi:hypothetical protein